MANAMKKLHPKLSFESKHSKIFCLLVIKTTKINIDATRLTVVGTHIIYYRYAKYEEDEDSYLNLNTSP